jgi:hypothetical protein
MACAATGRWAPSPPPGRPHGASIELFQCVLGPVRPRGEAGMLRRAHSGVRMPAAREPRAPSPAWRAETSSDDKLELFGGCWRGILNALAALSEINGGPADDASGTAVAGSTIHSWAGYCTFRKKRGTPHRAGTGSRNIPDAKMHLSAPLCCLRRPRLPGTAPSRGAACSAVLAGWPPPFHQHLTQQARGLLPRQGWVEGHAALTHRKFRCR